MRGENLRTAIESFGLSALVVSIAVWLGIQPSSAQLQPLADPNTRYNIEVEIGDKVFGLPGSGIKGTPLKDGGWQFSNREKDGNNWGKSSTYYTMTSDKKVGPGRYKATDTYITITTNTDSFQVIRINIYEAIEESDESKIGLEQSISKCFRSNIAPCNIFERISRKSAIRYQFRVGEKNSPEALIKARSEAKEIVHEVLKKIEVNP